MYRHTQPPPVQEYRLPAVADPESVSKTSSGADSSEDHVSAVPAGCCQSLGKRGLIMKQTEMLAMILAGGRGSRLHDLTNKVAKPAVAYGGKYRIVDFPLSNLSLIHI